MSFGKSHIGYHVQSSKFFDGFDCFGSSLFKADTINPFMQI
jgi:hypothetical protein